jgi:hypothetical protein
MALVQFSSVVSNVKGKIGGHYFKGSLGGATLQSIGYTGAKVKELSQITNSRITQSGQTINACLLQVVRQWKNVSAVNRAAWLSAAPNFPTVNKFGVPTKPSGYHCFVHINYARVSSNQSILNTPPAVVVGVLPPVITISTLSSASIQVALGGTVPTGYLMAILATRSMSAGIKPSATLFRQVYWVSAGGSGTQNITTSYESSYGAPVTGNTVWVAAWLSSLTTGQKTQMYIVGQVVS